MCPRRGVGRNNERQEKTTEGERGGGQTACLQVMIGGLTVGRVGCGKFGRINDRESFDKLSVRDHVHADDKNLLATVW